MNIELKPIAESKVRQLGGDVCGVLVRKDGRLAAVDEHGRVQWLQDGQGAEPVYQWREIGETDWMDCSEDWKHKCDDSPLHDTRTLYTHPQPAQPGSAPSRDDLIQCLLATRGQSEGVAADAILSLFSATTPQPAQQSVPDEVYLPFGAASAYADAKEADKDNMTISCELVVELIDEIYRLNAHPQPTQQGNVPAEWRLRILSEFPLLDDDGLDQEKHHCEWSIQQDRKRLHSILAGTPQPVGDAVAVPVTALEYLKDQWPGAYAKFYERICSNKYPQPPQGDGWIKCSERLPKLGQRVQLFSQGVIQHMMPLFDDSDEGLFWDFEVHDYNPPVDMSRDQWRPLPQPPQEGSGDE